MISHSVQRGLEIGVVARVDSVEPNSGGTFEEQGMELCSDSRSPKSSYPRVFRSSRLTLRIKHPQRIPYCLIHIELLLIRQTTHKCYATSLFRLLRQHPISFLKFQIAFSQNRLLRFPPITRRLRHSDRMWTTLVQEMLLFYDTRIRSIHRRIIHNRIWLDIGDILVPPNVKINTPILQRTLFPSKLGVNRTREENVVKRLNRLRFTLPPLQETTLQKHLYTRMRQHTTNNGRIPPHR